MWRPLWCVEAVLPKRKVPSSNPIVVDQSYAIKANLKRGETNKNNYVKSNNISNNKGIYVNTQDLGFFFVPAGIRIAAPQRSSMKKKLYQSTIQ